MLNDGKMTQAFLPGKELLKLLYENRDKIIDRKDILNLLWGNDSFSTAGTWMYIHTKLRSYIKEDPALEIITIKGMVIAL